MEAGGTTRCQLLARMANDDLGRRTNMDDTTAAWIPTHGDEDLHSDARDPMIFSLFFSFQPGVGGHSAFV